MAKRIRTSEIIDGNLDLIEALTAKGATNQEICDALGIGKTAFYEYAKKSAEFAEALKKGREISVGNIENSMYNAAIGGVKKVKKYMKVRRVQYEDGKKLREWDDIKEYEEEEYIRPDTTAAIFLLKNWAHYSNEPASLELRRKEVELKEKLVEQEVW